MRVPGGAPLAWVWGVRGRALSHPQPLVRSGVRPGPTTHWLWVREVRAWGPVTNPTARALASWLCALWGQHEGARGGRLLPGCRASGDGRSPIPDHPSFRARGRGPLPTCRGCGARAWGPSCPWHLVPCRGSSCVVRASRVRGTRWPLWPGTCPRAVVVAGGVPLWRASSPCVGAPRLVRSGRSRCSGRLSRRRGAFPQPGGCRSRLYSVAARGTWRPAENRAQCACHWPLPRQGRWAHSASYPFRAPRWGCPWRVPPASVLGCVRCGGLACVDPVTDASGFPYRLSCDGGLGRCTGAVSCGRRHRPFRVGGRHARVPRVCACACPAWPGRAGRPPGCVLVRLTFSLAVLGALFACSAPSGLGLPRLCLLLGSFFFPLLFPPLVAPPLCPALRVFRPRVPWALASCPAPPPFFFPLPPPLDDVAEVLEEAGSKRVSASEKLVLLTKAVADAWQATVQKIAATCPEAFGKLGYTWGEGQVVCLRSLPDYKFDLEEHFEHVCVTGADGDNAASSAAVALASASVSNTKRQLKLTSFFK